MSDHTYWLIYLAIGAVVALALRKHPVLHLTLPPEFRWAFYPMCALAWPIVLWAVIGAALAQLRSDLRQLAAHRTERRWYDRFL